MVLKHNVLNDIYYSIPHAVGKNAEENYNYILPYCIGVPDGPLTALDRIQRINETFSSVSVVWDSPYTNNKYISRYVLTVEPPIFIPANGVTEATEPLFKTRKITLVLMHDQIYSVHVRADNCNNTQLGIYSSALTINGQCIYVSGQI